MSVRQSEVFEAFRAIDIPEEKALRAAAALSKRDDDASLKSELLPFKMDDGVRARVPDRYIWKAIFPLIQRAVAAKPEADVSSRLVCAGRVRSRAWSAVRALRSDCRLFDHLLM